ncbi:MAG: hydratase [Clostridiales bacterium]|jgi:aconitate hydratase|nr:hydratase [Clostridiales bacterium]
MVELIHGGVAVRGGKPEPSSDVSARAGTIAGKILAAHDKEFCNVHAKFQKFCKVHAKFQGGGSVRRLKFDALVSHDITYVGIIQTARASGLTEFPLPYVLTNCHNSLCAVGGTINEDDHAFGLSAAKRFGGIYVPANFAVIHQFARERLARAGAMILGSDSHTRYGALGALSVGEGGGELVKQLFGRTYDVADPEVTAVWLTGEPAPGVGPMDAALAIIGAVFANGFVKNKIMEFIGPGVSGLSADFRNGIDVMTTETACLSSVWRTDEVIREYYAIHGREGDYAELNPDDGAYYDGLIRVDLSRVEPMIAAPFHPSNAYTIREFTANAGDILGEAEKSSGMALRGKIRGGKVYADQAVIAGCAGGAFENLTDVRDILAAGAPASIPLSVYPASQPVFARIAENGVLSGLISAGAVVKPAFCGPCFGAGDVPQSGALSVRHVTRNFPNREGSVPGKGQSAAVAIMDARSVAATYLSGGAVTPATELSVRYSRPSYRFDSSIYDKYVYNGAGRPDAGEPLVFGPNIADWPDMPPLPEHLLLSVAAFITDPVTTTDELIPSGETSSYRSNPLGLAEFTLSRKDPGYVARAKAVREGGGRSAEALDAVARAFGEEYRDSTGIGSVIYAVRPGDGSAREQAASCQKVLGGFANIAREYATKRYRSNLINWGMVPFILPVEPDFGLNDFIFAPNIREAVAEGAGNVPAYMLTDAGFVPLDALELPPMTGDERRIILAGCLINYYRE